MEPLRCKVILLGDGKVGKTCLQHSFANELEYLAKRQNYSKTLLENYELLLPINDIDAEVTDPVSVRLSSWDTAGQEEFDELRRMCYTTPNIVSPAVNEGNNCQSSSSLLSSSGAGPAKESSQIPECVVSVFILCFAWDDPKSLTSVQMRWYREIRRVEHEISSFGRNSYQRRPFSVVLCGTKFDLRVEADQRGINDGIVTREQAYISQQSINADALVVCSAKTGFGVRDVFHTAMLLWLQNQLPYSNRPINNNLNDSFIFETDNVQSSASSRVAAMLNCQLL